MRDSRRLGPRRRDVPDRWGRDPPAPSEPPEPSAFGVRRRVPFYRQSLDFSCGPACLLMAMAHHDAGVALTQGHEIDVWREANLVEIGATSRYGLALAAHRRGFHARVIGSVDGLGYRRAIVDAIGVNEPLMDLFFEDARTKCRAAGVPEQVRPVTMADVENALRDGEIPIVLTDTRMFTPDEEVPHWVVVTGVDGDTVFVNNPLDEEHARDEAVGIDRFLRGFGYDGDQLMVAVGPKR